MTESSLQLKVASPCSAHEEAMEGDDGSADSAEKMSKTWSDCARWKFAKSLVTQEARFLQ